LMLKFQIFLARLSLLHAAPFLRAKKHSMRKLMFPGLPRRRRSRARLTLHFVA
jgi:hypothetical protein